MAKKKAAEKGEHKVVINCDNLRSLKFNPSLPYAFIKPGIAQLSSVLHSEALETSVKSMSAFVAMCHFIIQNAGVLMRITNLEHRQIETDDKIDQILDKMEELLPKLLPKSFSNKSINYYRNAVYNYVSQHYKSGALK